MAHIPQTSSDRSLSQLVCLKETLALTEAPSFNQSFRVGILITEMELFCEQKWLQGVLLSSKDQQSDGGGSGLYPGAERASAPAAVPMDSGEMNELPSCRLLRMATHRLSLILLLPFEVGGYNPRFHRWESVDVGEFCLTSHSNCDIQLTSVSPSQGTLGAS